LFDAAPFAHHARFGNAVGAFKRLRSEQPTASDDLGECLYPAMITNLPQMKEAILEGEARLNVEANGICLDPIVIRREVARQWS
jgi:hypothetical protein